HCVSFLVFLFRSALSGNSHSERNVSVQPVAAPRGFLSPASPTLTEHQLSLPLALSLSYPSLSLSPPRSLSLPLSPSLSLSLRAHVKSPGTVPSPSLPISPS